MEYPIGHRLRRGDGIPLLVEKFERNLGRKLSEKAQGKVLEVSLDQEKLEVMAADEFVEMFVV